MKFVIRIVVGFLAYLVFMALSGTDVNGSIQLLFIATVCTFGILGIPIFAAFYFVGYIITLGWDPAASKSESTPSSKPPKELLKRHFLIGEYINKSRSFQFSDQKIRRGLEQQGWESIDIEGGFSAASSLGSTN